jgi:hypothetical protein
MTERSVRPVRLATSLGGSDRTSASSKARNLWSGAAAPRQHLAYFESVRRFQHYEKPCEVRRRAKLRKESAIRNGKLPPKKEKSW